MHYTDSLQVKNCMFKLVHSFAIAHLLDTIEKKIQSIYKYALSPETDIA